MGRLWTTALVVAVMAPVAAAGAATTYYGGGTNTRAGTREQFVSIGRTAPNRLDFWSNLADYDRFSDCGAVFGVKPDVVVNADGSFSASGPISPTDGQTGQFHMSGRFTRPGEAAGTIRATFTRKGHSCDTGTIHWHDFNPPSGHGTGKPADHAFFGGYTSQKSSRANIHLPLVLRLNGNHTRVAELAGYLNVSCLKAANSAAVSNDYIAFGVGIKDRKFKSTTHFTSKPSQSTTAHFTQVIHGQFKEHVVAGDWTVTVVIRRNSDGSVVDRCGGDTKHWTATRPAG